MPCMMFSLFLPQLRHAMTVTFHPLILNCCSISSVTCLNSVQNLSKIEQTAAALLTI